MHLVFFSDLHKAPSLVVLSDPFFYSIFHSILQSLITNGTDRVTLLFWHCKQFQASTSFYYGIQNNIDLCRKNVGWTLADILFYQKIAYFFGNFNIDLPDCVHSSINVCFSSFIESSPKYEFQFIRPFTWIYIFIPNFGGRFH